MIFMTTMNASYQRTASGWLCICLCLSVFVNDVDNTGCQRTVTSWLTATGPRRALSNITSLRCTWCPNTFGATTTSSAHSTSRTARLGRQGRSAPSSSVMTVTTSIIIFPSIISMILRSPSSTSSPGPTEQSRPLLAPFLSSGGKSKLITTLLWVDIKWKVKRVKWCHVDNDSIWT